jgi:hypothetical protein
MHDDQRLQQREAVLVSLYNDARRSALPAAIVPATTITQLTLTATGAQLTLGRPMDTILCIPYEIPLLREQRAPPADAIHIRTDGFLDSGAERSVIGFGLRSTYMIGTLRHMAGQSLRTAGQLIPLSHSSDAAICLGRRDGTVIRVTLTDCIFAEETPLGMLLFAERAFTDMGFSINKEPGGVAWLNTYGRIPYNDPRAIVVTADDQHVFFDCQQLMD